MAARTCGMGINGTGASSAPLCRLRRAPRGPSQSGSRDDSAGRRPRCSEQHVVEGRATERLQIGVESSPRDDHVGDDHREAFDKELVADRRHSRQELELPVRLFTGGATRIRSAPEDACAEGIRFHADFDPVASELS